MESTQLCLLVLGLVLAVGVHTGDSIHCYVCNSASRYEAELCADPIDSEKSIKQLKNCSATGEKDGKNYFYCRKMTQDVDGDYRVVRSCGAALEPRFDRCIERTGTKDIKLKYCECEGEGCNSAKGHLLSPILLCIGIFSILALRT